MSAEKESYNSLIVRSLAEKTAESAKVNGVEYAINELYDMIEEPIKQQIILAYSISGGIEEIDAIEDVYELTLSAFSKQDELVDTLDEQLQRNISNDVIVETIERHIDELYYYINVAEKMGILESLKKDGIKGYIYRCSDEEIPCVNCRALNGKEYKTTQAKIGANFPPIHPLCDCSIEVDGAIYKGVASAELSDLDFIINPLETSEQGASRNDVFKAWLVKGAEFAGKYELPTLAPCHEKPSKAIPFDKVSKAKEKDQWVHFFIQDRKFECVWNNPKAYLNSLKSFEGVISTDFSLYYDMPLAQQVWNTYRNRAFAFWLQQNGVDVIPNVRWGDERSYEFCFDGLPQNSTIAVSTNGCIQSKKERFYFKQGLDELVRRLNPKTILNYSSTPEDIFGPYKDIGIEIIQIPNYHETVRGRGTV